MAKQATSANGTPINKSQAIRDFLAGNPKADTKTVVAGLGEKGIKVNPPLVYLIRSKANKVKRRAKRDRFTVSSGRTASTNPVELFQKVRGLARELGGIKNLKTLVDLLAD